VVKPQLHAHPARRRQLFTEHIVNGLGHLVAAPVPGQATVEISPAFIAAHRKFLADVLPGPALGSHYLDGLGVGGLEVCHVGPNRARFAAIAVLYAWARTSEWNLV
jgi:hypothetical protein